MNYILKKILLICGVLASVLYILGDIVASSIYPGYRYFDQMVSQLSAVGAPTRPLMLTLYPIFNILMAVFGIGVLVSAGRKASVRITGVLIVFYAIVQLAMSLFPQLSMQLSGDFAANIPHMIATALTVLLLILFIAFGAFSDGKSFRIYSFITILIMLVFGALTSVQAPKLDDNFSASGFGAIERVCVYAPMIWLLAFALVRLKVLNKKALKD
jgi:hypothetical protein